MKYLYTFTRSEIDKIEKWLWGAKTCLDSDSPIKIEGCKAAIDIALRELTLDDEDRITEDE